MTNQEAVYKRNLESSILFMQQEHASTLKALHEEIQKLQKKCSDLTFQLNMQGIDLTSHVDPATQEHIRHLEHMIDTQRETQHELEVELEKKDKLIKDNDYSYKRQKMKYLEDLRSKNKEIEELKAENEKNASNTAFLTSELVKAKKLIHSGKIVTESADASFAPAPPKEARSNPRRSLHIRRGLDHSLEEVRVRKGSGGSSRSESPAELIRPFVEVTDPEIHVKHQTPLPPIRTSSGRVVRPEQVDVVHVSMHTVTKPVTKFQNPSKTGPTQEIQTLAVEKLSHRDTAWSKHPHESQSSDYH